MRSRDELVGPSAKRFLGGSNRMFFFPRVNLSLSLRESPRDGDLGPQTSPRPLTGGTFHLGKRETRNDEVETGVLNAGDRWRR